MNKLVLAVTVLILSVHSFAETPNANSVKTQQEATARLRKKTALEAVATTAFRPPSVRSPSPPASSSPLCGIV